MRRIIAVPFMLVLLTLAASAQQQAAIGFCALDKTLDFKTVKAGDKIALHLTRDLVVNGKTLMPRGMALSATVVDAKDGNAVSIVLDKATPKAGQEVPLIGIIAAVATPPSDLSADPFYSMNHSSEPTQRTGNTAARFRLRFKRGGADRDSERPQRAKVEPAGRFKRSDRDRWTKAELGPRQASGNDYDDRQEEELQAPWWD
jgi:hypothetical protein